MDTRTPVQQMTDDEILTAFATTEDPAARGFDDATYARVLAYELIRARNRVAHYRTLYTSFAETGKPFMIENLDELDGDGGAVPVKLVFSDDPEHVRGLEEDAGVVVWTEPELLDALVQERAVLDYFTDLLDELDPALAGA
jgi:hypothetical protein